MNTILTCSENFLDHLQVYLTKAKASKGVDTKSTYIKSFYIGNTFTGPVSIRNVCIGNICLRSTYCIRNTYIEGIGTIKCLEILLQLSQILEVKPFNTG